MVYRLNAIWLAGAIGLAAVTPARAQAPGKRGAGPTAAEFAALKAQVERQQELIMRLTQIEGEHYDFLVRLIQSGGGHSFWKTTSLSGKSCRLFSPSRVSTWCRSKTVSKGSTKSLLRILTPFSAI